MYKAVTPELMKDYEYFAIETMGISQPVLMENAGAAVESAVIKRLEAMGKRSDGRVAVVCGKGNNGGDGLVAARRLKHKGIDVDIYYTANRMKKDAHAMLDTIGKMGVKAYRCEMMPDYVFDRYDVVVDAIFGTGLLRAPADVERKTIDIINDSKKYVISVDVPSGLDALSGKALGVCVQADETVTFAALKTGLVLADGRDFCGKLTIADIGVKVPDNAGVKIFEDGDVKLPSRKRNTHKGDYGKLKIIAGSGTMPGAAVLTATAAVRAGAGLTTLVVPESMAKVFQQRVTESTLFFMPDKEGVIHFDEKKVVELMNGTDCVVIGPGLGKNPGLIGGLSYILQHYSIPVIIDADALNALVGNLDILLDTTCKVILTPHLREFARLVAIDNLEKLSLNIMAESMKFAKRYDVTLLLKGATSIITNGEEVFFNLSGSPALAKGGSGDVLSGLLGALAAGGMKPIRAATFAAFFFGKAGQLAAQEFGQHSTTASDVIGKFKDVL